VLNERTEVMLKITFKRIPAATGNARVTQGTRGWSVNVDGVRHGCVSVISGMEFGSRYADFNEKRWYWYAWDKEGNHFNSCYAKSELTADECKVQAKAWLKEMIK
jgi:hypothetical protein